ncbi:MAG: 1,2-phenylacetyl-CoA epoxidase subunit PaaD [Parvularculaceae bacterium]
MSARRVPFSEDRPDAAEIRRWLEDVPDPEIPAVSVIDLGIVRDVLWRGDELVIAVTPTYSGCPATAVIALDIENALRARGIEHVRIETRLAPPWTTDWISAEGRAKLKAFGIAPPSMACAGAMMTPLECPHCGSAHTERVSQFGSTPCKAQHRCLDCLEPFDHFKRF